MYVTDPLETIKNITNTTYDFKIRRRKEKINEPLTRSRNKATFSRGKKRDQSMENSKDALIRRKF